MKLTDNGLVGVIELKIWHREQVLPMARELLAKRRLTEAVRDFASKAPPGTFGAAVLLHALDEHDRAVSDG